MGLLLTRTLVLSWLVEGGKKVVGWMAFWDLNLEQLDRIR